MVVWHNHEERQNLPRSYHVANPQKTRIVITKSEYDRIDNRFNLSYLIGTPNMRF